jgi:hypothetical protein
MRTLLSRLPALLMSTRAAKLSSMTAESTFKLNDGTEHPVIGAAHQRAPCVWPCVLLTFCMARTGYGTYKVGVIPASASSATSNADMATDVVNPADCVKQAIECGYRFLDCAEFYANEAAVGEGIAASGVPREQLYLASKVWTTTIYNGPEAVQAQLEKTLKDLRTGGTV